MDDDFPMSRPYKKYSVQNSDFEPIRSSDLRDRIRKVSEDFAKPRSYEPTRNFNKTETSWKTDYNSRGQPVIKREEVSYTLPETGRSFRRSSVTETSSTTSKPPMSLRTRRTSIGSGEDFSSSRSSVRARKYSEESGLYGLPPRPSRQFSSDESKFTSSQVMRDARKMKESDDLTDNIQKMVNKMRSHHLDDAEADVRSISRTVRATSLDPFEDDGSRSRSKQRARLNQFTYGISKR